MQALQEAIRRDGIGLGTDIVKVDSFLNHKIDTALVMEMGKAFADEFSVDKPDLILTVEASGIAIAFAASLAMGNLPVVFAKKGQHRNTADDAFTAPVFSYTKGVTYDICVSRKYLQPGMRVLLIDDFLANGGATAGLRSILDQAGCELVGVGIAIEKGFQPGGDQLRAEGVKLLSLAIVDGIDNGEIIMRPDK